MGRQPAKQKSAKARKNLAAKNNVSKVPKNSDVDSTGDKAALIKKKLKKGILTKKKPSKVDLKDVIAAMKKDDVESVVVRVAIKYLAHYLKSTGLTKKLLKELIRLWSVGNEKVRVLCLLGLVRIYTKLKDKQLKEVIVKKLYSTFLDKCRITKLETMAMIGFMRHSLVELYKLDPQIAFKQAQTSVQQLTLTLKNAKTHKNEETQKTILNWQFCNCLILLSTLVTSIDKETQIKSLTSQIIQLNLDAIDLITSPRYYGFYIHLIENLIDLSATTGLFVPILPIIIAFIDRLDIPRELDGQVPKKEYNMNLLNHVSHDEAHEIPYTMAVLNKFYELLVRYLATQCHRIAFPELTLLACVQLRKWFKKNHGPKTQQFKVLLDKIKSDCQIIEEERKSINFAFTNYAAVDAWEKKMKDSNKLSLPKLVSSLTQSE